MTVSINTIKNWFKKGLRPTESQYSHTLDSFWHKDEQISMENVQNLEQAIEESKGAKTTYLSLENPVDLRELILLENPQEGDIAVVENYLHDVVHFVRKNDGWERVTPFNVQCVLRKNNTTGKFDLLDNPSHRPIGARYIITDPFGTGSFQFAVCYPNADNVVGSLLATADESDGSKGYIIGGSVGGRIGIMRITATNGFPIRLRYDPTSQTYSCINSSSDNVPSSFIIVDNGDAPDGITVNHQGLNISRNNVTTFRTNVDADLGIVITGDGIDDVELEINNPVNYIHDIVLYRHGTYTVPIDLLEVTGNYWISGRGQSKERINVLHLNQENTASFDQPHTLQGEFTIEFGVNNIKSGIIQSMLGHSTSTVGDNTFFFNGTRPFLTLNGITFGDAITIDAIEEVDNFIRLRRDTANDIFIKLNDNPETFMGNSDYTWTIDEIFKGAQVSAHIGYIRNLRIGDEYYNFAEKTGLIGASVYNSGNNPRTFTVVQGNEERAI